MIDEMLIVQLLAPMMTINHHHHHHHCHGNEHYQTDGCTDVDGRGGGVDDNGDIVDFDDEAERRSADGAINGISSIER